MKSCVESEAVERWLAGELAAAQVERISTHVKECLTCQLVVDRETENAVLRGWLRASPAAKEVDGDSSVLEQLLERISAIEPAGEERPGASRAESHGPPHASSEPESDIGRIGAFRLKSELGRGGMGIVFRAWDESLSRTVALKVLRPEHASSSDRLRLVREAQLASQFHHEHAVMIYSIVDEPDQSPYLVMEYVDGPALSELTGLKERPGPREVAALTAQVADALAAAHGAGLIHRDVKPGNILIELATGRPKLTDFGVARMQGGQTLLTRVGFVAGTPGYMSPEQARGDSPLDARTDIYSLGVTLYESLTGVPPFQGSPHLVLRQIIEEDPRPPRQQSDSVPRGLETICLKAMAREPSRRYQTAADMAADLRRWLAGKPIHARPVGRVERGVLWCRRNPRAAALIVSFVLAVVTGFLGVVWQWRRAEQSAARGEVLRKAAEASLQDSQASFARSRRAVDEFYTRFLQADALAVPGLEKVRHEVVEAMMQYYKELLDQHKEDLTLRRELAEVQLQLGILTGELGNSTDGIALLKRALPDLEQQARAASGDLRIRRQIAACLNNLGKLEGKVGESEAARQTYERGITLVSGFILQAPDDLSFPRFLAAIHGNLADLYLTELKDRKRAARSLYRGDEPPERARAKRSGKCLVQE